MFGCRERVGAVLIAASLGGLMVQQAIHKMGIKNDAPIKRGRPGSHKHYPAASVPLRLYFSENALTAPKYLSEVEQTFSVLITDWLTDSFDYNYDTLSVSRERASKSMSDQARKVFASIFWSANQPSSNKRSLRFAVQSLKFSKNPGGLTSVEVTGMFLAYQSSEPCRNVKLSFIVDKTVPGLQIKSFLSDDDTLKMFIAKACKGDGSAVKEKAIVAFDEACPHLMSASLKSVRSFEKAIKLSPSFTLAHFGLGLAYRELWRSTGEKRMLERAIEEHSAALRQNSDFNRARFCRANCYQDLEDARVFADIDYILAKNPDDSEALRLRGTTKYWKGEKEGGTRDLEKALSLSPNDPQILSDLGFVYRLSAQPAKARELLLKSVDLSPTAYAYVNLARISVGEKNYARALTEFNAAIFIEPSYKSSYAERAFVYDMLGDYDCALRDYGVEIARSPEAYMFEERGWLKFSRFSDAAGALVEVERSLQMDPTCESALELRKRVKKALASAS